MVLTGVGGAATIDDDARAAGDGLQHLRQHVHRASAMVELAAAVIHLGVRNVRTGRESWAC